MKIATKKSPIIATAAPMAYRSRLFSFLNFANMAILHFRFQLEPYLFTGAVDVSGIDRHFFKKVDLL